MLIDAVAQTHPLNASAKYNQYPPGSTIAEIVDGFNLNPRYGIPQVNLIRNGYISPVPLDLWGRVKPKTGTRVEIGYEVGGELAALAVAAISAAAPYAAAAMFPTLGTFGMAMATAAISVVGALALNALIPPVQQPKRDAEQYVITGITNTENKYGIYPKVLGRHRIFPPKTARGYTETVGKDIYYRGRMTFGWGPLALEDLRIGTTPIHEFEDVEIEFLNVDEVQTVTNYPQLSAITKAWRHGKAKLTLCPDDVSEDGYNTRLMYGASVVRVTRERTESASIDIAFPQGLISHTARKGEARSETVSHRFRYRPLGGAWVDAGTMTKTARHNTYIRFTHTINFPSPGEYEIEILRLSSDATEARIRHDSYLSAIRSFRSGDIPSHENIAEVAFRLRASEQLSGNVDSLNAVVQQMAPIWTGTAWTAPQPVRHPAWVYLDAIRGPHIRRPVQDARIDLDAFKRWADDEPGWTCDYVIDAPTRLAEVLDIIAASGRARRALTDLKYSVIRDGAAGPVRQMFSPRNSWGFKGSIAFPRPIHALRVLVRSERLDWEQDEVTVYADGFDHSNATEFETLEIPGVVITKDNEDEGNAWRLGRYHLAQATLRPESFEWYADWEHMRVTRGDKVQMVHDVPVVGVGAARVSGVDGRRNSLLWTEAMNTNSVWANTNNTITEATVPPPFGNGKVYHIITNEGSFGPSSASPHTVGQTNLHSWLNTQVTVSAYFKDAGARYAAIRTNNGGGGYYADVTFDLQEGIVTQVRHHPTPVTNVTGDITPLGDGWFRCELSYMMVINNNTLARASFSSSLNPTGNSWGDGIKGVYVCYPQREVGDRASGYQKIDAASNSVFGLVLDEVFDFPSDAFRLTVRAEDGSRHSFNAHSPFVPETREWSMLDKIDLGIINSGDLVFIEEVAQESMELLITGVFPDGDNARITAVPAAPGVLLADQGAIPPYEPVITPSRQSEIRGPELPVVRRVISDESTMVMTPDGLIQARIGVVLEPVASSSELGSVQLRWRVARQDDPWTIGPASALSNGIYLTDYVSRRTEYEVEVRTISNTGRSRGWVSAGVIIAKGTEAVPPDVTGFVITPQEQQVQLRWNEVTNIPDIAWAEIRYAAAEGADWNSSVLLERVAYPMNTARLFARPGTYLIKLVDWDGRMSVNAASEYVSHNQIATLNAVETLEVSPGWSGVFQDTEVSVHNALILNEVGGAYPEIGYWTTSGSVDLGAVYPVQITPHIVAGGISSRNTMDKWISLAALPSLAGDKPDEWRIDTEVSKSDDNVNWSDWQVLSGGDFVGRYFRFRVVLHSSRSDVTPRIDNLVFVLDMPDRVDGLENVLCPAAGMRVTYDPAYRNIPSVVATPRDAPSGARLEVTDKDRTGFNIRFFDAGGNPIAQHYDWVSRGYGREIE